MMQLIDTLAQSPVYLEDNFMRVYEDGTLEYTETGVRRFGPMFRRHGYDVRTTETYVDHEMAVSACLWGDLTIAMMNPPEEAIRHKRVRTHIERVRVLRGRGRKALARLHERAIYDLAGPAGLAAMNTALNESSDA